MGSAISILLRDYSRLSGTYRGIHRRPPGESLLAVLVRPDGADVTAVRTVPFDDIVSIDGLTVGTLASRRGKPKDARARLAELKESRDPKALEDFMRDFPGVDVSEVSRAWLEDQEFETAVGSDKGQALEVFLWKHPGARRGTEAQRAYCEKVLDAARVLKSGLLRDLGGTACSHGEHLAGERTLEVKELREFTAARSMTIASVPALSTRRCIKNISLQIAKGRPSAKETADGRRMIEFLARHFDARTSSSCTLSPVVEDLSATESRVLRRAYLKLASLVDATGDLDALQAAAESTEFELNEISSAAAQAVDDFEAQELAAETLFGRESGDRAAASNDARGAQEMARKVSEPVRTLMAKISTRTEYVSRIRIHNLIVAALVAEIEGRHARDSAPSEVLTGFPSSESPSKPLAPLREEALLASDSRLLKLKAEIEGLRRKAALLRRQAGVRIDTAKEFRANARSIRDGAFEQSAHLTGIAAEEKGEARESLRRAGVRGAASGYAGAKIGNGVGGDWGALAGWAIGKIAAGSGELEAQGFEGSAARREVQARLAEKEAEAITVPLESKAQAREGEAEKLLNRSAMFESQATAKDFLLRLELLAARVRIISSRLDARFGNGDPLPAIGD